MKKLLVVITGLMLVGLFAGPGKCQQPCKIGIIDMEAFQEKSVAFQKIRDKLRAKYQSLQQKLDKEKEELMRLEEEFRKQSMMLSLDAKETKKKELEKKKRYYKYLYEEYSHQMKDAELEARRTIGKEIEKIVEEIGKKQGFTIILERKTMGLVYYRDEIDITDQVVKAYDRMKKK